MAGDTRRVSNGDQVSRVASLAMKRGKRWTSRDIGSGILPIEGHANGTLGRRSTRA
jgi:hypothetical protein